MINKYTIYIYIYIYIYTYSKCIINVICYTLGISNETSENRLARIEHVTANSRQSSVHLLIILYINSIPIIIYTINFNIYDINIILYINNIHII